MELNHHKIWNHGKKKVTNCCQRHRTKRLGWRLHRGWRKKTPQVSHMIHLFLIWILWSTIVDMSETSQNEVKWRQLNYPKCNLINGWEMYFISSKNVSWNTGDLVKIVGSIVDQSIIRYNYSDKFSYWNWKNKCINESKPKCKCTNWYKNYPQAFW